MHISQDEKGRANTNLKKKSRILINLGFYGLNWLTKII